MNKKGWIKIVEAFVAILILVAVLILVITTKSANDSNTTYEIYEKEVSVLREIELNLTYRNMVLASEIPLFSYDVGFSDALKEKVNQEMPSFIECVSKICSLEDKCDLEGGEIEIKKDIYSQSVPIYSNSTFYSPRQIKLFCWINDFEEYEQSKT